MLGADHGELQAQQVRGGEQDAIGVERELAHDRDRAELEEFWVHKSSK